MKPSEIEGLEFAGHDFDPGSGTVRLSWRITGGGAEIKLEERFDFGKSARRVSPDDPALQSALDLLHWIAGVSYWKVACRGGVRFSSRRPDAFQADALEKIYRHGLAELAWNNQLHSRYWPEFAADSRARQDESSRRGLARRALVPMGGGKDSLVALERIRALGMHTETVQVGSAPLIGRVADRAGCRHHVIRRQLSPELNRLNAAGALNGHIPITAINAAAMVVAALLWDFDAVVFANERSADSPTLTTPDGQPVNHQFAKSLACEQLLGDWVARYVAADLEVFSLLRRDRELSICKEFAGLVDYHDVFSSCNRNFHLEGSRTERWCGSCPKCQFVFLALAPFMSVDGMAKIFGRDLLAEPESIESFASLLELDGHRPFECVGEADEARAAVKVLAGDPRWRDHAVIRSLSGRLDGIAVPELDAMTAPGGPHRIPERFLP